MSERRILRVRDVMQTDFGLIDGKATVRDALRQMRAMHTSTLLVQRRHEDDEIGMLMVTDIATQVLARDRAPSRVNVYEVMQKPVVHVHPDMDIRYCSRIFAQYNLSRAPVVRDREVVGTVSPYALVLEGLAVIEGLG